MYMLVKHVHDMYMSRHAFIVKKNHVHVMYMLNKHVHASNCLIYRALDVELYHHVHVCAKFRKIVFLERKDTETQRFILNNSKETKNAPCGALAFKKIIHDDQKFKPENDILRIRKKRKARFL